ncbi:hypothetical protein [Bacillus cereus group sp. TH40LC]|uniref:hypothetical protein n=1 Tax=Bacillus cereus group sp. TH40LC TaxID=3018039 RepID=UPI0022E5FCF5|nr:hypothetical protein [Bacillus cereus group sp. TH40LC]MDA1515436.1 hypothetical protein [Bacillus cereus group sp. TH40LC]
MAIVRQGEVLEGGKKISGNFKDGFKFNNGIANKHIIDPDVWSMNIRDVEILTEEKSRSKKSVAGRAIVGGVLLGGVGAVVGGVTAKNKTKMYAAISYHNGMQDILEVSPFELNDLKRIAEQNREKGNTIYRDIEKDYSNYPPNQNVNKQESQSDTGSLLIEIFSIVFWIVVLIMIIKWLFT